MYTCTYVQYVRMYMFVGVHTELHYDHSIRSSYVQSDLLITAILQSLSLYNNVSCRHRCIPHRVIVLVVIAGKVRNQG